MSGPWSEEAEEDASLLAGTTDVELIKRAWRNEKAAPEILQFEGPLVLRVREQIQLLVGNPNYYLSLRLIIMSSADMPMQRMLLELFNWMTGNCLLWHSVLLFLFKPVVICLIHRSGDEIVDLVADDLYVIRYKSIKGLVEAGQIDLV
ncbi:hypothetical protein BHE74_00052387 [Ensete ventricosum]|nr:hypothetical protein GW17_00055725 [Ensete ventricosum]RWW42090.1 hypothetical protein BHE74_00052387 [Ensete ventricosum]